MSDERMVELIEKVMVERVEEIMVEFMEEIKVGDILAVKGTSRLAKLILSSTKGSVSHVGIIIGLEPCLVLESLRRVKTNSLRDAIHSVEAAYILQPKNLTLPERIEVVREAVLWSTTTYGWGKLPLHGLDALFGTQHFSRNWSFTNMSICSWLVGRAYERIGKDFGEPVNSVTPEDIYRFAQLRADLYHIQQIK